MEARMTTVIVEPDAAAAWAGLAGAVVGGLLTGGWAWLRLRHDERKERRREIDRAVDELLLGGNALIVSFSAFKAGAASGNALLEWTQLAMAQVERVQAATAVLRRLSPEHGPAAVAVQVAAVEHARVGGDVSTLRDLQEKLQAFSMLVIPKSKPDPR